MLQLRYVYRPLLGAGLLSMINASKSEWSLQVWNLARPPGSDPEHTIPAKGPVQALQVNGNNIMWADDEAVEGDAPGVPVAMVHLLNTADMTTVSLKVGGALAFDLLSMNLLMRGLFVFV